MFPLWAETPTEWCYLILLGEEVGETKASHNLLEMNYGRNYPEYRISSCSSEQFLETKAFY